MLGEFFAIGPNEDVRPYIEAGPWTRTRTVEGKTLSVVSLASLAGLLDVGREIGDGHVLGGSGEAGAFPLPDAFRDALADGVPDEAVARWADTEELRLDRWTTALARETLDQVQSLAADARAGGRSLWFYWSV